MAIVTLYSREEEREAVRDRDTEREKETGRNRAYPLYETEDKHNTTLGKEKSHLVSF